MGGGPGAQRSSETKAKPHNYPSEFFNSFLIANCIGIGLLAYMSKMSCSSTQSTRVPVTTPNDTTAPEDNTNQGPSPQRLSADIAQIAKRNSTPSTSRQPVSQSRALAPAPGSNLDPSSPAFDAHAWVQDFIRACDEDPKSAPSRALGVAFKSLSVFGWGSGAAFQRTTGSVVSDTAKYLVRMVFGKQKQRVGILHQFEGVVEKGEMLLVLGPPGSGCSTLLKTLSGETQGLELAQDSHIDFRGNSSFLKRRIFLTPSQELI